MSEAVSLPTRAKIGPFVYRISTDPAEWVISEQDASQLYGFTDNTRGTIIIHEQTTLPMKRVVLLHELLHATAFTAGQLHNKKRTEEQWVEMVAPMLLDALRNSPGVVQFLLGADEEVVDE